MRNPTAFLREEFEELVSDELDWKLRIVSHTEIMVGPVGS